MSQTLNSANNVQTQSGNRVVIEFGGIPVGLVQSVRASEDYGHEPASGIGNIEAIEMVPGRAMYSLNVTFMTFIKNQLRSAGITALDSADVLQGRVFNIVTYSKDTNAALSAYINCSYVSGDVSIDAHRIVITSAVFKALSRQGSGL